MNTIYLIRHSKALKVSNLFNNESLQFQNEKKSLSIEGEKIAKDKLSNKEFENIDAIYSSNYVRAIQTSKYLAINNNLEINVVSDLGERKFGIDSWDELPNDFERKQFLNECYKIGDGESQIEVKNRMYNFILKILNECKNKKIAMVSHGTAIFYLLMKWCNVDLVNDMFRIIFDGKIIFEGNLDYCETFKLEFDDNNKLINIENIKF